MRLLVAGGTIGGRRRDLRIDGGRIVEVAPGLRRRPGEDLLDASGCPVAPGLHDHHLHLRALAAAKHSAPAGPPAVTDRPSLAAALRRPPAADGWVRAIGYHDSVAGPLDATALDAMVAHVPVRVQHRSGALWIVNSAGAAALDLAAAAEPGIERDAAGRPTGRLFRLDDWLGRRLPVRPSDLATVSARLASWGVTGFTDATPGRTAAEAQEVAAAVDDGRIGQRVHLMCPPGLELPAHERLSRGPHKVLLDDDTLPGIDELADEVGRAHRSGVAVAFHCVTQAQLVVTLAALRQAGSVAGDRIEHAAVVEPALFGELLALGLTVVTNPSFVAERGDAYLAEVDPADLPHLYRCASLQRAGIAVAAGTDAPFASADPWLAIEAAVRRRTTGGAVLGADEALAPAAALALFFGRAEAPKVARRLTPGQAADLCLRRSGGEVAATVVAGRVIYRSPPSPY